MPTGAPPFLARLERFERVGSTNDVVRDWLAAGVEEVAVAVADEQTAGRGRGGRTWTAPPGAALLLSVGFRPGYLPPDRAWRLAAIVALAMADAGRGRGGPGDRHDPPEVAERPRDRGRRAGRVAAGRRSRRRRGPGAPQRTARDPEAGRHPRRDRGPRDGRPAGGRRDRHQRRLAGRRLPGRPRRLDDLAPRRLRRAPDRSRRPPRRLPRPSRDPPRGAPRRSLRRRRLGRAPGDDRAPRPPRGTGRARPSSSGRPASTGRRAPSSSRSSTGPGGGAERAVLVGEISHLRLPTAGAV